MSSEVVCSRCVMDSTFPSIRFNDRGICNYCREYEDLIQDLPSRDESGLALTSVIRAIADAGKGKAYDCVIGLSGGIDSTYAAYIARNNGLRLLGVHLDNGWNDPVADVNVKSTANTLDIELVTINVNELEFHDLQLSFLRASVPGIEIPTDHAIRSVLYRETCRRGLRYAIAGGNVETEGILPRNLSWNWRDARYIRGIHKRFGSQSISSYPLMTMSRFLFYRYLQRISMVRLLNYVPFNKEDAKAKMRKEIGWNDYGPKHFESVFTRFYQAYILPRKFGIDKRKAHLSTLIMSCQISREEAVRALESPPYPSLSIEEQDKAEVTRRLGLTLDEFESLMSELPKSVRDYPSSAWIFRIKDILARHGIRVPVEKRLHE